MVKRRTVFLSLLLLALSASSFPALARPLEPEGRTFLLQATLSQPNEQAALKFSADRRQLVADFTIPKGTDIEHTLYALFLGGADHLHPPEVLLNGRRVAFSPVRKTNGLVLRLPAGRLLSECNSLEIRSSDELPLQLESLEVFSLLDTFEEVHFEQAFSEIKLLVQPPKHPDQDKYDALHYDLALELNMWSAQILNGVLTLEGVVVGSSLNQVVLDFEPNGGSLSVSSVDSGQATPALSFTTDDTNNWLLITLPATLYTSDIFTVRIFYSGTPSTAGVWGAPFRAETHGSGVPIVFSFSQPYGARQWWPCKDIPEDKATVALHITADDPYWVVSNGSLLSVEDVGGGKRCFHYAETYPIVTYLVSICCTNYLFGSQVYTSQDGTTTMTVGHYVYPENSYELGGIVGTLEAMNLFSQMFGEYPFIGEKYVTATHNSGAGMEHQTCTSMPPGDLYPDGRGRRNIHELAHMWFGDCITMEHYDHLWLNEGFGTYCEALYVEHFQGMDAYHDYVNGWESTGINDSTPLVNPNADLFWGSLVYRKGAWVLHMLRRVVGDTTFFAALTNYLNAFAYSTALTPDLQAEFEAVYGSSLDWFFQEWVYGAGRPTYNWSWYVEEIPGDNILHLTITQTQSGSPFEMPLDVKVSDLSGNFLTPVVWNDQSPQDFALHVGTMEVFDVEIDPDNWVLNRQGSAAPRPTLRAVVATPDEHGALVSWESGGGDTAGFQLIVTENLSEWSLAADYDVLSPAKDNFTCANLSLGKDYYFRIRALSTSGRPSALSDTYGIRLPRPPQVGREPARVLIVDGYDRWDSQARGISHPWAAWHGQAVAAYGVSFDSCDNEAVLNGSVKLADYDAVLWVLGEESTADETFSSQEQALVRTYLDLPGNLFVSGAEVGWDLDHLGGSGDRSFYNNYLKASYVRDDSYDYSVYGTTAGIFKGLSFDFDDGSAGIYFAGWPDVVAPYGGSTAALRYNASDVAGIQFKGTFPNGSRDGCLVYLGFGFETIYPAATRAEVMSRILAFFGLEPDPPTAATRFHLYP